MSDPLSLSIDDLFRVHLPSFVECLSAAADEEVKSFALLLKLFAAQQHQHTDAATGVATPPLLLKPSSLFLSGTSGTGKRSLVERLAGLLGLHVHVLSFGRLILRRGVASQAAALRAELAEVRLMSVGNDSVSAPRGTILLLPRMELTFAAADERDEDALALQNDLLSFLREVAEPSSSSSSSDGGLVASGGGRLLVVGLASSRSKVSPALLRAFQFRFKLNPPSDAGRARILAAHLGLPMPPSPGESAVSATVEDETSIVSAAAAPSPPLLPFDAHEVDVNWIASQTQSYVGADLVSLIKSAVAHALPRRHSTSSSLRISLCNADFHHALAHVRPASLKSMQVIAKPAASLPPSVVTVPAGSSISSSLVAPSSSSSSFSGVGGLEGVKAALREVLLWPFRHRTALQRLVVSPSRGALLYGVPGVGKTLLASGVAREFGVNFLPVKVQDLLSSGVGESEKKIVALFARARSVAPAVLFLDEIQALFASGAHAQGGGSGTNAKLMAALLQQIDRLHDRQTDGVSGDGGDEASVFVLAATNLPWALDPALLRPGRIDQVLLVPPPTAAARKEILLLSRGGSGGGGDDEGVRWSAEVMARLDELATLCEGFSAVDVVHLVGRAGLCAARRLASASMDRAAATNASPTDNDDIDEMEVRWEDFEAARQSVTPSITPAMIEACERWGREWKTRHAKQRKQAQSQEALALAFRNATKI
jgi:SpoVK/Ycf46/Vps4 family AAA+-type ATPase